MFTVSAAVCSAVSCSGVPSGLTANVLGATADAVATDAVLGATADAVATDAVSADDGCEMVVLAARVWVLFLVDVPAIFLDFRPDARFRRLRR